VGCVCTEVRLFGRHSGTTSSRTQNTISILQAKNAVMHLHFNAAVATVSCGLDKCISLLAAAVHTTSTSNGPTCQSR
jgi:hypothetical protein